MIRIPKKYRSCPKMEYFGFQCSDASIDADGMANGETHACYTPLELQ